MQVSDADLERSDRELVELAQNSPQAFKVLVDRYWRRLYAFVKRLYFMEHEEVEDVIQEAFLKIYRNLQAFDDTFSFSTWAYQITRNCAIDSLRKKRVRPQTVALTEEEWEQIRVIATEEHDQPFDLVLVKKAIQELPLLYREPFTLFYLEQKTYEEMVDILKKPKGTIASLVSRAKVMVRARITQSSL
jgi:RNA polymerase sigma-70 factor (ECF subfamily)